MNSGISSSTGIIRRRLWQGGGLVGCFILSLIVTNFFLPSEKAATREMIGHDFLPFYAAGSFARTGQFQNLYDLTAIKLREQAVEQSAGLAVGFGPWWNPPFAAWVFAPFSYLPFSTALIVWEAVGLIALAISLLLLARMLPDSGDWRNWGLLLLLEGASNPFIEVIAHGQNTFITLLLLTITATLWRARRAFTAGLIAGLLCYKPQHALLVGIVLIVSLGWRAAAGLIVTGGSLLLVTIVTMPGALGDYLHKLPAMLIVMQEQSPYSWDRHVTLKAFWRLLLQGNSPGPMHWLAWSLWWMSEIGAIALLGMTALAAYRDRTRLDRLIAATILAGPLLTPFCFDYDLMILAVPATLCAADAMRRGSELRLQRLGLPLLWAWAILYLVLHVSTPLAQACGLILAVPAMGVVLVIVAVGSRELVTRAPDERPERNKRFSAQSSTANEHIAEPAGIY